MRIPQRAWRLTYRGFDAEEEGLREALCALGNGYFVTRAAAPEASADEVHYPGTYLAGCYNRLTTEVSGRPVENEDLVNVPNWLPLTFRVEDGEWFHLSRVKIRRYRLDLDMHSGVLTRFVAFRDDAGRQTEVTQRRLVHMGDKNVAALETVIVARNWSGPVTILAALDGTVTNAGVSRYRELDGSHLVPLSTGRPADDSICLVAETSQSHVRIAEAARLRLHSQGAPCEPRVEFEERPGYVALHIPCDLEQDVPLTVEKTVAIFSSRERGISEPGYAACRKLARTAGFAELLDTQAMAWDRLWRRCAISLNDHGELNRTLHLHIFHALQTVSPNSVDLDAGVGARGLHGEAYRGHVFWDEAYIFPFFNHAFPELTRELLMYRYRRLPEARRLAQEAGFAGALYPWQSGSDGREETQVIHLNPQSGRWLPDVSHLQRHVNAAIAYNVWQFWESTRDEQFLCAHGGEMLLEIARFFASLTTYDENLDRYEIRGVMGPDEYQTGYPWTEEPGLANNAYTNVMAAWVLSRALDLLRLLPAPRRDELVATIHLTEDESALWERMRRRMRVDFHDGVISQFEHYDRLEEFDWDGYTARYGDIQRLDRILEKEGDTPNRYRAGKQADVLMLFYLFSMEELTELFAGLGYSLDEETAARTILYYAERTSHGSTLSGIVHAWSLRHMKPDQSWSFFQNALHADLLDMQGGTTREGIHLGTMAGTVDLIERAYVGLEIRDDVLWFDPDLPPEVDTLRYALLFRGHWIDVEVDGDRLSIGHRRSAAGAVTVGLGGKKKLLKPGAKAVLTLDRRRTQASAAGARHERLPDGRGSRPATQPPASMGPGAGQPPTTGARRMSPPGR
ncbi:MAG: glycoside hydrolase family 65 protein [Actinobacteria bacterium]|nr:glycoside hydrolase family 65 protein [Actinomycetota bacterium]